MKTTRESKMSPPIFIGRWTPKILFSLKERPHRYGQLRRHLGSVSQRMLTRTPKIAKMIHLPVGAQAKRPPC